MATTTEIAKEIVKYVKTDLANQKKKRPNNSSFSVEFSLYTDRNKGTHTISGRYWGSKDYAKDLSRYDTERVAQAVITELKALQATRGWKRLVWEIEDCYFSCGWSGYHIKFPTKVTLMADPCKEYTSLVNYIAKYCGKTLTETDIYSVAIGGKRGRVYGEEGERYYLCHKPTTCAKYLETLRKSRGSNDKVVCSTIKEEDDIDPWELQVSIRNEVEFGGVRLKYFEITISTPSGKQKAKIRIG
jgi:hypothetical protein